MRSSQDRRKFLQVSLGTLGHLTLAGWGGNSQSAGGNATSEKAIQPAQTNAPVTESTPMFDVSASAIAEITARPASFVSVYNALGLVPQPATYLHPPLGNALATSLLSAASVRSQLGAQFTSLTSPGCLATFASVIASKSASIGPTTLDPMNATLGQLLVAESLVCGHFCKLATLLSLLGYPELIPPDDEGSTSDSRLHFLVWLDSVPLNTGFHSQLVISNVLKDAYLLLDPMYALALRIPFVGAGPQASLSTIENAAAMMQTPISPDNLVKFDARTTTSSPQMLETLLSGALGPQYIYHDSIYGSEGWDTRIAQIIANFG